ncbi:monocarboxylate transporter 12-like [Centruroides vittatus]|uniref:monocarboxylate transporter 12-like n=1 Tax=Centruroides vittatus TaxID=120091 RepID=UPI00350ED868
MKFHTPDKGWAWIFLAAAYLSTVFDVGILRSTGVLFIAFRTNFDVLREDAAWPPTIRKVTGSFSLGIFIGFFSHFVSIKKLAIIGVILTVVGLAGCYFATSILILSIQFGFFLGLGSGMVNFCTIITVNRYFKKYRTIALGITYSGTATGAFIFPIVTSYLLNKYGLHGCFLILSGIAMQAFVTVSLYKTPSISEKDQENKRIINSVTPAEETLKTKFFTALNSLRKVFHFIMFHVIWITVAIYSVTNIIFLTVMIDYAMDCGIPQKNAVYILSVVSISEFSARLCCGLVVDAGWLKRETVITLCFLIDAVLFSITPICSTYIGLLVIALCLGFVNSSLTLNVSALFAEYLGLKNLPLGYGTGRGLTAFIHFSSPSIIGYFRDTKGSYTTMFYYFGGACLFACVLWLLEPLIVKIQNNQAENNKVG